MKDTLGILIPTRGRPKILGECLNGLISFKESSILEVIVVTDNDKETFEFAKKYKTHGRFWEFTPIETFGRLYQVGAYNFAFRNLKSDLFCWIADDAVFVDSDWIARIIDKFKTNFPDNIGVVGMGPGGAGFGVSSKAFVRYNNGEFYYPGYKVHYSDNEIGMRAIMMGRYDFLDSGGVGHQKYLYETYPAMDLVERYLFIKEDKNLFSRRKEKDFYIDPRKIINPIDKNVKFNYSKVSLPLPRELI